MIHLPTGTKYNAITNHTGGYSIQAIRPGGPYTVKVTYIGYKTTDITDINAGLGTT